MQVDAPIGQIALNHGMGAGFSPLGIGCDWNISLAFLAFVGMTSESGFPTLFTTAIWRAQIMTKTDDKVSETVVGFNSGILEEMFEGMEQYVNSASRKGTPIHDVERTLWGKVLQVGKQLLGKFITQQGNGDLGDTVTLPNGQTLTRFIKPGKRTYRSVFGNFVIERTVYGKRDGQKIEFAPLDNRLLLPENEHSHLLQDWTQHLSTECPFHKVHETLKRILFVNPSTESLERINRKMGNDGV